MADKYGDLGLLTGNGHGILFVEWLDFAPEQPAPGLGLVSPGVYSTLRLAPADVRMRLAGLVWDRLDALIDSSI